MVISVHTVSTLGCHTLRHLGPVTDSDAVLCSHAEHVLLAGRESQGRVLPLVGDWRDPGPLPRPSVALPHLDDVLRDVASSVRLRLVPAQSNRLFAHRRHWQIARLRRHVYDKQHHLLIYEASAAKARALKDGDVPLFVCPSVRSFVRLSLVQFIKSFTTRQHLAASGGFSYRLRYIC